MKILHTISDDRTRLRLVRWGDAERDVLFLHGLAEHAGRYEHIAARLVDAGWRVTLLEMRGHGESEGKQGHVDRWHAYVEDVQAAVSTIGRPFAMVGHSMGGMVAVSTLSEPLTPKCKAVALSNPLLGVRVDIPLWKRKAAGILSRLVPKISQTNEVNPALLSHDKEAVRAYETDPKVYGTVTPRWFVELKKAQASAIDNAKKISIPLRLMVSEGDQICNPQIARNLAAAWGGPSEVIEYGEMYHELFNEVEKDRVLTELIAWLETVDFDQ